MSIVLLLTACGGGGGTVASTSGGQPPVTNPTSTPTQQPSTAPTAPPTQAPTPPPPGSAPSIAGCRVVPADNPWNADSSAAPVDAKSAAYHASMNAATTFLHPDFGSNPAYGIPYTSVGAGQPPVPMTFDYASESGHRVGTIRIISDADVV